MSHNLLVHVADDAKCLIIAQSNVFKNDLVDVIGAIYPICNSICMFIRHLNLACIKLSWLVFTMKHPEAFRYLASLVHPVIVLDQMASFVVLVQDFIQLDNFICVLVLAHRVLQSWLTNCEMVFHIVILVTILAFS